MSFNLFDIRAMDEIHQTGPPYPSKIASTGLTPNVKTDIPILAVLLTLYLGAAVGHMTILQLNNRRGHKFILSSLLFGFSMARIMTCTLRMAWATHLSNVSVAIAAQIFTNLGIIIIFIVNIIFAQRIFRARHPTLGWHNIIRTLLRIIYALTIVGVLLLLIFIPWTSYTLNKSFLASARDIQLAVLTWLLIFACVPIVLLSLAWLIPRTKEIDSFGKRSLEFKTAVVAASVTLCLIEEIYRVGTGWADPRPKSQPAWYDSKASFYCFIFVPELFITYMFLAVRVDKVFHVPNGSSKRNTFAVLDEDFENESTREQRIDDASIDDVGAEKSRL